MNTKTQCIQHTTTLNNNNDIKIYIKSENTKYNKQVLGGFSKTPWMCVLKSKTKKKHEKKHKTNLTN